MTVVLPRHAWKKHVRGEGNKMDRKGGNGAHLHLWVLTADDQGGGSGWYP